MKQYGRVACWRPEQSTGENQTNVSPTPNLGKFALSVWQSIRDGETQSVGKHYDLDENCRLVKGKINLFVNRVHVETFDNLEELVKIITAEDNRHSFYTSGLPDDWREIADDPERAWRKVVFKQDNPRGGSGCVQRTKEGVPWQPKVGGYLVVDFDPDWCPFAGSPDAEDLRQRTIRAADWGGFDISNVQWLTYKSSSSSLVSEVAGHAFDEGGLHLIALVDDASDLERFRDAMLVYLTLTGSSYAGLSKSGALLHKGILDKAAVLPNQPTFMAPVSHGPGLRVDRGLRPTGGDIPSMDTRELRDPTEEERELVEQYWRNERERLKPQSYETHAAWQKARKEEISEKLPPGISNKKITQLIERRLCGQLIGDDMIHLDAHGWTRVADILIEPEKYDLVTCADPVEPDYGGGQNIGIIYMNQDTSRPILFSQAHGGFNYELLFDRVTTLEYLTTLDSEQALDQLDRILHLVYTPNTIEADALFKTVVKKVQGARVTELRKEYDTYMRRHRHRQRTVDTDQDEARDHEVVSSLEYQAARKLRREKTIVCANGTDLWLYTSKYWTPYDDDHAAQDLLGILERNGWSRDMGNITRVTRDAVVSLKYQAYDPNPFFLRVAPPVINCQNGELWFLDGGTVELRPHDSRSGLTHVLSVDHDPDARSELFKDMLYEMFLHPAQVWEALDEAGCRRAEAEAEDMVRHISEVLAYLLVPERWLAVWFLFIGDGSNGKTLLMKLLQLFIPESAVVNESLHALAGNPHGMARLIGKTLTIDDDLDTGVTLPDGFLKKISEAKQLSANVKHNPKDVPFLNRSGLVVLSNNYPRLKDLSAGSTRRIQVIEFPRRFYTQAEIDAMPPERRSFADEDAADPKLLDRLKEQRSGILSELVAANSRLRRRGVFKVAEAVRRATDKALRAAHPLNQFIKEMCVAGPGRYVPRPDFRHRFRLWADAEGIKWDPSSQLLTREMEQLSLPVQKKKHQGTVVDAFIGISLKDAPHLEAVQDGKFLRPKTQETECKS